MENLLFILENELTESAAPKQFKALPLGLVHSSKGDFLVDNESFSSIRKDFKTRQLQIPIDYEHQTLRDGQAPAAGWVKDLILKEDGIYAVVDWTTKAAEYLSNREYKYCSPVVMVRPTDRKALLLHSIALTNKPAINAMTPIVNSDGLQGDPGDPATQQSAADATDSGSADEKISLSVLARLIGLEQTATSETIIGTIKHLVNQAESSQLNLNALKFEAFKEKVDNAVTLALTEGKIAPYQRDWAYRNAMNDLDDFVQWCKDALPVVPMGRITASPSTVRSRSVCRSDELLGLSPEDIRKFGKAPHK